MTKKIARFCAGSLALIGISMAGCGKGDKTPATDMEKVSYAIGQQIGSNIKSQDIKIDVDVFAAGVRDVMDGKESKMKPEEMQAAMMQMQKERQESRDKEAETNLTKGNEWLEKNKVAEGVKVTASGLQYKVLKEGTGRLPKIDDAVRVHYKGTLVDGTEFDSSHSRGQPAEFPLKGVIPGWTEALQLMKVGSTYQLFIPPDLAYGKVGRPKIPANSVLVFEVELLDILSKEPPKKDSAKKG